MQNMDNFKIINETKKKLPLVDFSRIKKTALGTRYVLSLIFTTPSRIKKLNTIYRDLEKPTDILSFPLSEKEGEIYICEQEAKKECKKFDREYKNFLAFLFIHGCVHLKGHDHGSTMELVEVKLRKRLGV